MERLAPVRVLGLGNVLMGDDALGPWVVEALEAGWHVPAGVSILDVGTPGLDLTPYLAEADTVILVDTIASGAPPGTVRVLSRSQLLARAPGPRVSPHDPGLTEALLALDFGGAAPRDVILVGVVPASVERGVGLSAEVRGAVEKAVREVVALLACLGFALRRRRRAAPPSPWWERAAEERVAPAVPVAGGRPVAG